MQDLEEREEYLRRFARSVAKSDWLVLAYALMSTHIHLVLLAGSMPPRLLFQPPHGAFALWLNRRQSMRGQLFAGRYKLWPVRRPPGEIIAYVHNNPVRAGVVTDASASRWTSHRSYLAPIDAPAWLSVEVGLEVSGFASGQEFGAYVEAAASAPRDFRWSGEYDGSATATARRVAGAATEVSEPIVSDALDYALSMRPRAFAEFRGDFTPEQVLGAVSAVLGTTRRNFCGRSKSLEAVRARRLALRLWRGMQGTQAEMCAALGMSSGAACGLLRSTSERHLRSDEERVWVELLRQYPQGI